MFDSGAHYATSKIMETVGIAAQNLMWLMIENMAVPSKDYLQVFHLSVCEGQQKIVHTQEVPPYLNEVNFLLGNPITAKIYVIDDGSHSTMLLAEEY